MDVQDNTAPAGSTPGDVAGSQAVDAANPTTPSAIYNQQVQQPMWSTAPPSGSHPLAPVAPAPAPVPVPVAPTNVMDSWGTPQGSFPIGFPSAPQQPHDDPMYQTATGESPDVIRGNLAAQGMSDVWEGGEYVGNRYYPKSIYGYYEDPLTGQPVDLAQLQAQQQRGMEGFDVKQWQANNQKWYNGNMVMPGGDLYSLNGDRVEYAGHLPGPVDKPVTSVMWTYDLGTSKGLVQRESAVLGPDQPVYGGVKDDRDLPVVTTGGRALSNVWYDPVLRRFEGAYTTGVRAAGDAEYGIGSDYLWSSGTDYRTPEGRHVWGQATGIEGWVTPAGIYEPPGESYPMPGGMPTTRTFSVSPTVGDGRPGISLSSQFNFPASVAESTPTPTPEPGFDIAVGLTEQIAPGARVDLRRLPYVGGYIGGPAEGPKADGESLTPVSDVLGGMALDPLSRVAWGLVSGAETAWNVHQRQAALNEKVAGYNAEGQALVDRDKALRPDVDEWKADADSFESAQDAYTADLKDFNTRVAILNARGGADPTTYAKMLTEADAFDARRTSLTQQYGDLSSRQSSLAADLSRQQAAWSAYDARYGIKRDAGGNVVSSQLRDEAEALSDPYKFKSLSSSLYGLAGSRDEPPPVLASGETTMASVDKLSSPSTSLLEKGLIIGSAWQSPVQDTRGGNAIIRGFGDTMRGMEENLFPRMQEGLGLWQKGVNKVVDIAPGVQTPVGKLIYGVGPDWALRGVGWLPAGIASIPITGIEAAEGGLGVALSEPERLPEYLGYTGGRIGIGMGEFAYEHPGEALTGLAAMEAMSGFPLTKTAGRVGGDLIYRNPLENLRMEAATGVTREGYVLPPREIGPIRFGNVRPEMEALYEGELGPALRSGLYEPEMWIRGSARPYGQPAIVTEPYPGIPGRLGLRRTVGTTGEGNIIGPEGYVLPNPKYFDTGYVNSWGTAMAEGPTGELVPVSVYTGGPRYFPKAGVDIEAILRRQRLRDLPLKERLAAWHEDVLYSDAMAGRSTRPRQTYRQDYVTETVRPRSELDRRVEWEMDEAMREQARQRALDDELEMSVQPETSSIGLSSLLGVAAAMGWGAGTALQAPRLNAMQQRASQLDMLGTDLGLDQQTDVLQLQQQAQEQAQLQEQQQLLQQLYLSDYGVREPRYYRGSPWPFAVPIPGLPSGGRPGQKHPRRSTAWTYLNPIESYNPFSSIIPSQDTDWGYTGFGEYGINFDWLGLGDYGDYDYSGGYGKNSPYKESTRGRRLSETQRELGEDAAIGPPVIVRVGDTEYVRSPRTYPEYIVREWKPEDHEHLEDSLVVNHFRPGARTTARHAVNDYLQAVHQSRSGERPTTRFVAAEYPPGTLQGVAAFGEMPFSNDIPVPDDYYYGEHLASNRRGAGTRLMRYLSSQAAAEGRGFAAETVKTNEALDFYGKMGATTYIGSDFTGEGVPYFVIWDPEQTKLLAEGYEPRYRWIRRQEEVPIYYDEETGEEVDPFVGERNNYPFELETQESLFPLSWDKHVPAETGRRIGPGQHSLDDSAIYTQTTRYGRWGSRPTVLLDDEERPEAYQYKLFDFFDGGSGKNPYGQASAFADALNLARQPGLKRKYFARVGGMEVNTVDDSYIRNSPQGSIDFLLASNASATPNLVLPGRIYVSRYVPKREAYALATHEASEHAAMISGFDYRQAHEGYGNVAESAFRALVPERASPRSMKALADAIVADQRRRAMTMGLLRNSSSTNNMGGTGFGFGDLYRVDARKAKRSVDDSLGFATDALIGGAALSIGAGLLGGLRRWFF